MALSKRQLAQRNRRARERGELPRKPAEPVESKTCATCSAFEIDPHEPIGHCYALPQAVAKTPSMWCRDKWQQLQ